MSLEQLSILQEANFSECPTAASVQSDAVKANFSMDLFAGEYYEIYYHDVFQTPGCYKGPTCQKSVKLVNYSVSEYGQLTDIFSLDCMGGQYIEYIYDNLTTSNGILNCSWSRAPFKFQDFVVATSNQTYKNEKYGEQYEWVIELQCVQPADSPRVAYVGMNFYTYNDNPSDEIKQELLDVGRKQGLGVYMNSSIFSEAVHDNCTYP